MLRDCCIYSDLEVKTSGALTGGFSVDDYVNTPWQFGGNYDRKQLGPTLFGFRVQIIAPFQGNENCGVSQQFTIKKANDFALNMLGILLTNDRHRIIHPKVGDTFDDVILDPNDPFAVKAWHLKYKDGIVSFADVPGGGGVETTEFTTCFHSKDKREVEGGACNISKCCIKWTLDTNAPTITDTEKARVTPGRKWCEG